MATDAIGVESVYTHTQRPPSHDDTKTLWFSVIYFTKTNKAPFSLCGGQSSEGFSSSTGPSPMSPSASVVKNRTEISAQSKRYHALVNSTPYYSCDSVRHQDLYQRRKTASVYLVQLGEELLNSDVQKHVCQLRENMK